MSSFAPFLRAALCAGLLLASGSQAAGVAPAAAGASGPSAAPASAAAAPLELGIPDLRQRISERLAAMRATRAAARHGAVADAVPGGAEPVAPVGPEGARQAALAPQRAGATPARARPAAQAARGEAHAATASVVPASAARRAAQRADAAAARGPGEPHWSYEGATGPEAWATLDPAYARCGSGRRQSPIDVRDGISVDLQPLDFDYRPGAFSVLDDGRTVRVDVAAGSTLAVGGRRYMLRQFHFHRPSEERLDGRGYPMSAHLVHADAEGRLAVVAVLIDGGKAHPLVQQVWNDLPLERHAPQSGAGPLDPAALLPEDRRYATFMGSLTTPPCTEGVLWIVLRQPATMSPEQMAIFARLYPMNARPLQAASGRLVKQSN